MPDDLTPDEGTDEQDLVTPQVDPPAPAADPEPPVDEQDPDNQPEADPEPAPELPAPAAPTVEERYRQSSSEALILNSKNKNLESTLKQLTSEDTPNEAELLAEYPDFKTYNAVTQRIVTDTLANKKARMRLNLQIIKQEAASKLESDIDTITVKPEYASLSGDRKFKQFVLQPQHASVDIQTLADAYLMRTGKGRVPGDSTPPTPKPAPAGGIPRGSGGPRNAKPQKLSLEAAKTLRETNSKEWMRMAKAGLIEDEI